MNRRRSCNTIGNLKSIPISIKSPAHSALVYRENIGTLMIGGLDYYIQGESDDLIEQTKSNRRVEQIYRPKTWNRELSFPKTKHARFNHKAQVYKNSIYVTGGQNYNLFYVVSEIEVLNLEDLDNLRWKVLGSLTEPRHMHNIQIFGNIIYNFGGYNESGTSETIESFDIQRKNSEISN